MKKLLFLIVFVFVLTGCSFPIQGVTTNNSVNSGQQTTQTTQPVTTTTQPNLAQLTQADLDNIKQQVMNELRQEIEDQYSKNLTDTENAIINVVNTDSKAVLGVSNFQKVNGILEEVASGSGVIYKHDAQTGTYYMVTNNHVIDGGDKISVVLPDKSYIDAQVVGADAQTDLAVLKFQSSISFPTVEFADSDQLQVGQFAIAIGNPLGYDYYGSVTSGIVSGLSRNMPIDYNNDGVIDWDATLIQHCAPISPGNSGGGLFDIHGKLIGINNMKIVENTVSNIGFAIPSNTVSYIISQLEANGKVVRPSLGIVGSSISDIIKTNRAVEATNDPAKIQQYYVDLPDGVTSGVFVDSIVDNSSAAGSDLKPGDIITKYNDTSITNFDDLKLKIDNSQIGDKVTLTVNRNGVIKQISLTLIERPNI